MRDDAYYTIAEEIEKRSIIPVIAIDKAEDAEPLAQALINAGLPAAEITFRTSAARKSIEIISNKYPEILTGAGTVLTIDQVKEAVDAGSKFLVSPGFNPAVVDYCILHDIVIYPGVSNPTGVEMALERGLDILKFFPAEASGGVKMVNAMGGPYGDVKFMATGGININNLISYLDSNHIIACGGSWMVKPEMIKQGKFDVIEKLCREAVEKINNWREK